MRVLGYGEDALTYWALSTHMTDVIGRPPLNDNSPADKILLVYRPSFGRAGGDASAQFGEFDAIIGTPKAVYLVESKWTGEPIIDGQIILAARQIRRHQVFHWIRDRWLEQAPADWAQFHNRNAADFAERFQGKPLAPPGSRLASNLRYVLQQLPPVPAKDVLLYFRLDADIVPEGVSDPGFLLVLVAFRPLNLNGGGRVVDMRV